MLCKVMSSVRQSTVDNVFLFLRLSQWDLLLLLRRHSASCKDNFYIGAQLQLEKKNEESDFTKCTSQSRKEDCDADKMRGGK